MFWIEFFEIPWFRRECVLLLLSSAAGLQPDMLIVPLLFVSYIPQFPHPFCVSTQRLSHTQTCGDAQNNLDFIPNLQPTVKSSAGFGRSVSVGFEHSVRPRKMGYVFRCRWLANVEYD